MIKFKIALILLAFSWFVSCVSTQTISKTNRKIPLTNIGLISTNGSRPNDADYNYQVALSSYFTQILFSQLTNNKLLALNDSINFKSIEIEKIKKLCTDNTLDGLLLSKLSVYKQYSQATSEAPLDSVYFARAEMKLLDKQGIMLLYVISEKGLYASFPEIYTEDGTIEIATKLALKRILKIQGIEIIE